jgi:hypothetical protein
VEGGGVGVEGSVSLSGGSGGGGQGGSEGGLLGARLQPAWPDSRASLSPDVGSSRRLSSRGQQQQEEEAPWENQVLDTRILQN